MVSFFLRTHFGVEGKTMKKLRETCAWLKSQMEETGIVRL